MAISTKGYVCSPLEGERKSGESNQGRGDSKNNQ